MGRMSKKKKGKVGRPPKADKHEGFASFSLPIEIEQDVEAYKAAMGLDNLSAAYRMLLRNELARARAEGIIK